MNDKNETNCKSRALSRIVVLAGIFALVAINLYVLALSDFFSRRTKELFWFYCDVRYWPGWYSLNLWIVVCGLFLASLLRKRSVLKKWDEFYASQKWRQFKSNLKNTGCAGNFVRFLLRRRGGKAFLVRWLRFWKTVTPRRYATIATVATGILVFCVVFFRSSWFAAPRNVVALLWLMPHYYFEHYVYIPFFYRPWTYYLFTGRMSWAMINAPALAIVSIILLLRVNAKIKRGRRSSR